MDKLIRINVGPARLSYPHLFEPNSNKNDDKKTYDCCLLIPKSNTALVATIKKAMAEAIPERFIKDGKVIPNFRLPLRDGDLERAAYKECEGMHFLNAKSFYAPKCVKKVNEKFVDATPEELYAGCWVIANIQFKAYEESGNKGLSAKLVAILKHHDDESLSGTAATPEAIFEGVDVPDTAPKATDPFDDLPF